MTLGCAMFYVGLDCCMYWVLYRGNKNAHRVLLVGIVLVSLGLLGLLFEAYERYFVVDDANNDHHDDHGLGTSDDHVIINITELASVNPSILIRSIPAVDFHPRNFEDGGVECVVCISELADGDKAKLLPSCRHWFHAHCIDPWLESHATCPICRTRVRLFQTNEPARSGKPTCSDVREVVVDIPTTFEVGDLGPYTPDAL